MRSSLSQFLGELEPLPGARIAVLGIGNPLNGDDGAGVRVAHLLARSFQAEANNQDLPARRIVIYEAGPAPEAFTGPLRRFRPDLVIMVDAAELGLAPGESAGFHWSAAQGMSASTHTLPPSMLARYLVGELGCQVMLVGIQPRQLELDHGLSDEVKQAVTRTTRDLKRFIQAALT